MSLGDASSNSNTIRDGTESQRRKKNMVNKIFTAMFLISVVAFAPAAAWAHTGHHHHHHHHNHHQE